MFLYITIQDVYYFHWSPVGDFGAFDDVYGPHEQQEDNMAGGGDTTDKENDQAAPRTRKENHYDIITSPPGPSSFADVAKQEQFKVL